MDNVAGLGDSVSVSNVYIRAVHAAPNRKKALMSGNDFFARLPEVPWFTVTSTDVVDGQPFGPKLMSGAFGVEGGEDRSPQLSWSGAPEATKSYAVTVYDPDAPTGAGFWHWAVADIPASVTELPSGAGDDNGSGLPEGAYQLPNDVRGKRFIGAAPPAGHGMHRYVIVVHALDVEHIGVPADATPSFLGFNITSHILGRAVITATAEIPA
jgi:Raf kinase inhibitor-like YbhB/YbcL family protein